jgi:hypothetical protein
MPSGGWQSLIESVKFSSNDLKVPSVKMGGCVTVEIFLPFDFLIGGDEQDSMSAGQEGVDRRDLKKM